jgi:DNA-binding response OmpR family regulator
LVIEDDRRSFTALAELLDAEGFLAVRARHGEEALRMAKEIRPAVVALDLMPNLEGWSVFEAFKADPETSRLPMVILGVDDHREVALALGVDDYFVKPVDVPQLVAAVRRLAAPAPGPVLVIDDDPTVLELLAEALGAAQIEALTTTTGQEGLEMAASRQPAVIVLDLVMPEMSGFEVAQRLAQDPRTASIPIVVLTAKDLTTADRLRLTGQVVGTFGKGPSPAEVVRSLEALLRRHHPP